MRPLSLILIKQAIIAALHHHEISGSLVFHRDAERKNRPTITIKNAVYHRQQKPAKRAYKLFRAYADSVAEALSSTPLMQCCQHWARLDTSMYELTITYNITRNYVTNATADLLRDYAREHPANKNTQVTQALALGSVEWRKAAVVRAIEEDNFLGADVKKEFANALRSESIYHAKIDYPPDTFYPLHANTFRSLGVMDEITQYHPRHATISAIESYAELVHEQYAFLNNRIITI